MSWITEQQVADRVGVSLPDDRVSSATAAARAYVERVRSDLLTGGAFTPGDDVLEGTIQFAAHLYSSKAAPGGFSAYGDGMGDYMPASMMPSIVQRLIGVKRPVTA